MMITEEEARKQNLPGSDVFLRTQLAYKDELNRDALIVHLNREAYKAFIDTITIGQFPLLKKEGDAALKGFFNMPTPTIHLRLEYIDLDNLKIAAGFELHLKASLLSNDIVIHFINGKAPFNTASFKALRKKQELEPVYKQELLAIEGFYYNGERNELRGLTSQSLNFEKILNEPNYRSKLGKSQDFLDIVEDYRNLRNQIHLPGDAIDAPHLTQYKGSSLMKILEEFINKEIVEYNNKIMEKWKLNTSSKLPRLDLFKTV
jgi:hypothetical protein